MYEVLNDFIEKKHDGHTYRKGEKYPALGKKLVKARAAYLTKVHDIYGVAFLKEVPVEVEKKASAKTKTVEEKIEGDA